MPLTLELEIQQQNPDQNKTYLNARLLSNHNFLCYIIEYNKLATGAYSIYSRI